jgi:SH3 domain-containing YSC84-like protein 1
MVRQRLRLRYSMYRMDEQKVRALNVPNDAARLYLIGSGEGYRMKRLALLLAKPFPALCLLLASTVGWTQDDKNKSDIEKRIENAAKVLDEIMATPDKGIPDKIMGDAKCIAVVPSMLKIAVGFGGSHGKGVASCRLANGNGSGVAPVTLTGGSWGLQLGGQAIDLVMIVMNDDGMQHLLSSKFKIGADASAAAGPVGRHAGADTDWKMKSEVLTYSRSRVCLRVST